MITIFTQNSTYEYDDIAFTLKRINHTDESLRRDEDALKVLGVTVLEVGKSAVFFLDLREDGIPTLRITSIVKGIVNDF